MLTRGALRPPTSAAGLATLLLEAALPASQLAAQQQLTTGTIVGRIVAADGRPV
ncbi:MAG: hypothetical protein PVH00_07415 [Gemmatimonadota bacterium]|jgi:hypothetical protein